MVAALLSHCNGNPLFHMYLSLINSSNAVLPTGKLDISSGQTRAEEKPVGLSRMTFICYEISNPAPCIYLWLHFLCW